MPRRTIPGHEIVGTVIEADDGAGVSVGDRVAVDPLLGCRDKGLEPCPECRVGRPQICHATGRSGMLTPGHGSGYNAAYGGGWAEQVVAPAERVHRVPDVAALDDSRDRALREAGAHAVIHGTQRDLVVDAGQALGVQVAGDRLPGPILEAGFDVVYDCIGSEQTLDDALRMTR